jgi:hypothetical protein
VLTAAAAITPTPAHHHQGSAAKQRPSWHAAVAFAGALALLVVAVLVGKNALGGSAAPDTGTQGVAGLIGQGNPQVAALRSDVLSIATAEETEFSQAQGYVAASGAGGQLRVGVTPVRLSALGEAVTIVVSAARTSYCIKATRTPAGATQPQVVVYVSSAGGLQPSLVTACPAVF